MNKQLDLLKRATNPLQYDRTEVSWEAEGKDLSSPMRAFFWEKIMQHCPNWQGRRVLDIGAGTGWALEEAKKLGADTVVGIEPAASNVRISRRLFPRILMVQGTFEDYRTIQKFDRIMSVMSFPHIGDLKAAFQKVRHLMAEPAGEFVTIVPDYDYYRRDRHGYAVTIEDLNSMEFVSSILRDFGEVVDIVRKEIAYVLAAEEAGLTLLAAEPMPPSEELISKVPKYGEFRGVPFTTFLKFRI
jgi:SAM-dependent methyltransferase